MAERSSSASSGKYSKLSQTGNESGKDSKSKKRRQRNQKKEKLVEQSVQAAESSSLLSTAEHSESRQNFTEFVQNTGDCEGNLGQAMANEPTAELVQDAGVSEVSASNLPVADAKSVSRKDLASEENVVTDKVKELPKEERVDANNDSGGKGKAEHKPLEQQQASSKNKMVLLSFGRSKKNKTQKSRRNAPQETSGEKTRDNKESAGAEGGSVSHTAKSKFLDEENEQEVGEDREMDEPGAETSAMEKADNSPEDVKTVENNEGPIGEHKRAQKAMNTAGSNKAKKFKPLASFRRHKKKADPAKSVSADESTGEKAEEKHHLKADCDDVFNEENDDKVSNNEEEEEEKTGSNENARKKSTGKKFSQLRSFRRSKASKKSTGAGKDGDEKSKETSQEKDTIKEETCEDSDVLQQEHGVQQSDEGVSAECTGEENPEQTPEEEHIQAKCGSNAEAMTPTKKEKKKGLLRRQMKKMWSTSGKSKEASNTEKEEGENVADERSEVQDENGDPQASSPQNPPNPPAEASSEEGAATETLPATEQEELVESADLLSTAETEIKKADETNLEAAPMEDSTDAEMHSTEKTEKIKKSKGSQIKNGDEAKLTEESSGASGADNKEISKQVKRKRSGFQKISNALKRKKSREDSRQNEDKAENEEGLREKGPQETDHQTANAEVNSDEDGEQRPLDHDKADAEDHEINEGEAEKELQSDQEETEKINDSKECPAEENISESVERQENCKGTSATENYKAHGNPMKAVIQELLEKIAKIQADRASAPAEPETEPEEESEFTKTSDDYSLTEVTSLTTGDSSPSFADACNDDKASEDPVKLEGKLQETNETEGDQDGGLSDDTKDVDADADDNSAECVPNTTEYVPNTPEAERERPDETNIIEIPTYDADSSAVPTSIPEAVPNPTEAETSGKWAISEDVGSDSEIHRGSEESEEGYNEESEASQEKQEREITAKSPEDLHKSNAGVTSDLESSQTAPSKGRKEDWILVNHLDISQELSHQLKVLALDSFEHGTQGCCSMM